MLLGRSASTQGLRLAGLITLIAGVVVFGITLGVVRPWEQRAEHLPEFALVATTGGLISPAQLAGRPYLIFFGFTHCPDICPTTLRQLSDALDKAGPMPDGPKVFFVTVDPERDTPAIMASYLSSFDPRLTGLSGSRAGIDALIRHFRVVARRVPTSGGYVYDHSTAIYMVNSRGQQVGLLNLDRPVDGIAADLKAFAAAR